jgi:hypothetical protein
LSAARCCVGPRGLKLMTVERLIDFEGSDGSRNNPFGGPRFFDGADPSDERSLNFM